MANFIQIFDKSVHNRKGAEIYINVGLVTKIVPHSSNEQTVIYFANGAEVIAEGPIGRIMSAINNRPEQPI